MTLDEAINGIDHHIWTSEPEVGKFIASFIKLVNAKNVIECGTFKGLTSCYIIDSIPKDGKFVSVDIQDQRCESVIKYFKQNKNCKFVEQDSSKFLDSIKERTADVIFLDSFHEYEFISNEFKHAERVIKQHGWILIHDYYSAFHGVGKFIEEIKLLPWFEVVVLETPEHRGLVIVRCLHVDYPKL